MPATFSMGKLVVNVNKVDLETMYYESDKLKFSNTKIRYKQSKPFVSNNTENNYLFCGQ
jgi:translocation and assembly module TamB